MALPSFSSNWIAAVEHFCVVSFFWSWERATRQRESRAINCKDLNVKKMTKLKKRKHFILTQQCKNGPDTCDSNELFIHLKSFEVRFSTTHTKLHSHTHFADMLRWLNSAFMQITRRLHNIVIHSFILHLLWNGRRRKIGLASQHRVEFSIVYLLYTQQLFAFRCFAFRYTATSKRNGFDGLSKHTHTH